MSLTHRIRQQAGSYRSRVSVTSLSVPGPVVFQPLKYSASPM